MKQFLKLITEYLDYISFLGVVLLGAFFKVHVAAQKGKTLNIPYVLAEITVSIFVAVSVWAVCDQFFNFNKFFTYVLCAWLGSMSTLVHSKIEEIFIVSTELIKKLIKNKVKTNDELT